MPQQSTQRVTVGVNDAGAENLQALMDSEWFEMEKDVYLLAISAALARDLEVSQTSIPGIRTKFNVGSLDQGGQLKAMVKVLAGGAVADPYDHAERLAHAGLEYLKLRIVDQGATLSEVFGSEEADD